MSQREIGPRVGNSFSNHQENDVDIQAFIERTPKTNEQMNREKVNSSWEYSVWMIVIIGIVIVLLVLVLWFIFKKDEVTDVQKHIQLQQPKPPHPSPPQKQEEKKNEELHDEKLMQDARDNLTKKKIPKRDIGPVPGIIPDNPAVVGIKEPAKCELPNVVASVPAPVAPPAEAQVPENLPDIQSNAVLSRLTSNFGLSVDN